MEDKEAAADNKISKEETATQEMDKYNRELEGKRSADLIDSFTPQEFNLSNVQEDRGQKAVPQRSWMRRPRWTRSRKAAPRRSQTRWPRWTSTIRCRRLSCRRIKREKDKKRKKMEKEEVPKEKTWINWWKNQWRGSNNLQA